MRAFSEECSTTRMFELGLAWGDQAQIDDPPRICAQARTAYVVDLGLSILFVPLGLGLGPALHQVGKYAMQMYGQQ